MPVEIFQRAARRVTQSTSARSQLRPDKRQPDVTHHSHPRPQPCCWTAWMILEKFFYVLLYHCRKFFNRKRGHILGNVRRPNFGLKNSKRVLRLHGESDARTHRTPKALRAKVMGNADSISRKLSECARVLASLWSDWPKNCQRAGLIPAPNHGD